MVTSSIVDMYTVGVVVVSTVVASKVDVVLEVSSDCVVGTGAAVDSSKLIDVCTTILFVVVSDVIASDVSTIDAAVEIDSVVDVDVTSLCSVVCVANVTGGSLVAI